MKQLRTTLTVRVTDADIRRALPLSATHCPIARAVRRETGAKTVLVSASGHALLSRKTNTEKMPLWNYAYDAIDFANDFDKGRPVKPCTVRFVRR